MNNFGVIEVASTATKTTPGWAYVPDTGPALPAALQPKNRKRAARNQPGLSLSDLTARQENKLRKDLEALNKDNQRDVVIPIPHKSSGSRSQKHTPNVRKILQSQKTFANHLDDYQALLALAETNPAAVVNNPLLFMNKPLTSASATPPAKSASPAAATPPPPQNKRAVAAAKRAAAKEREEERKRARLVPLPPQPEQEPEQQEEEEEGEGDVPMTDVPAQEEKEIASYPPDGTILPAYKKPPPAAHPGDNDPLLVSVVPNFPTDEELRALMTAPPLNYMEARATFGEEGEKYPTRVFCEMCGYWGRVKCMKCGVRVCALDCLEGHREECVTRYGL